jgi:hypothetical protein
MPHPSFTSPPTLDPAWISSDSRANFFGLRRQSAAATALSNNPTVPVCNTCSDTNLSRRLMQYSDSAPKDERMAERVTSYRAPPLPAIITSPRATQRILDCQRTLPIIVIPNDSASHSPEYHAAPKCVSRPTNKKVPLPAKNSNSTNHYKSSTKIQNPSPECTNSIKVFENIALCRKNNSTLKTIGPRNKILQLGQNFEDEVPVDFEATIPILAVSAQLC